MTSASPATPTNDDIAQLNGWRPPGSHFENYWGRLRPGGDSLEYLGTPPDYLNDPGTLGEWNELLAQNGWTYAIDASAPDMGILCTLFLGDEGEVKADEDTELKAKWVAAWRASQ